MTGQAIEVEIAPRRPGDPATLYASSALARTELGWIPEKPQITDIVADQWRFHQHCPVPRPRSQSGPLCTSSVEHLVGVPSRSFALPDPCHIRPSSARVGVCRLDKLRTKSVSCKSALSASTPLTCGFLVGARGFEPLTSSVSGRFG